jgi:hypothetical protein
MLVYTVTVHMSMTAEESAAVTVNNISIVPICRHNACDVNIGAFSHLQINVKILYVSYKHSSAQLGSLHVGLKCSYTVYGRLTNMAI